MKELKDLCWSGVLKGGREWNVPVISVTLEAEQEDHLSLGIQGQRGQQGFIPQAENQKHVSGAETGYVLIHRTPALTPGSRAAATKIGVSNY